MNAFGAGSSQGQCPGPQLLRLLGLPWFLSFPRPVNYPGSIWFLSPFPPLERHPGFLSFTMSLMKGLPQAYVTVLSNSESHSPGPPRGLPPSLGRLHKSISNALLSQGLGGSRAAQVLKQGQYCCVFIVLCVTIPVTQDLRTHH